MDALAALYPSMAPPAAAPAADAAPTQAPAEPGQLDLAYSTTPAVEDPPPAAPEDPVANLLYDPMGDGVNYTEAAVSDPAAVAVDLPEDVAGKLDLTDMPQVREAFVEAGVGLTLSVALVAQAAAAVRSPITTTPEQAYAELQAKFGSQTDAKIQAARELIDRAAQRWPGVHAFLEQSGLGNDPKLITRLAARAARLPKR